MGDVDRVERPGCDSGAAELGLVCQRAALLPSFGALEPEARRILDSVSAGIVQQGADGTVVSCNPAAERILGLPKEQLTGLTSFDSRWRAVREDGTELTGEEHPALVAVRTGLPQRQVVMTVRKPDGTRTWIVASAVPIPGQDGHPGSVITSFTEIRALWESRKALADSEQNLRGFFDTIDDFVFVLGEGGEILHVNESVRRRLGYDSEDLLGRNVLLVHPEDRRAEAGRIVAEMLEGKVRSCPVPVLTKHGERVPVETRVVRGRWNGRDVLFGLSKNISELKASEEKFAATFRASPSPMALTALPERQFLEVNDAFVRAVGYEREEVLGRTADELGLFPSGGRMDDARDRIVQNGSARDLELEVCQKDGGLRYGVFAAEVVRLQDRNVLLTVMHDHTEQRQVERELENYREHLEELVRERSADLLQTNEALEAEIAGHRRAEDELQRMGAALEERVRERTTRLEQANGELEAFSYSVSHDLRAPLRAIDGFAGILTSEHSADLNGEGQRLLGQLRGNAHRMAHLIDDLLSFSRLGRAALQPSPIDMADLVRSALAEVQTALPGDSRATVTVGELPVAVGDASMLRQVWCNLLSNALKFSAVREVPTIEVDAWREGGFVVYRVRDNGVGFDMAYSGKLFSVFQRLHGRDEFEGTGVGLALSRRIVERHAGWIHAWGEVGAGATMTFGLPEVPPPGE